MKSFIPLKGNYKLRDKIKKNEYDKDRKKERML